MQNYLHQLQEEIEAITADRRAVVRVSIDDGPEAHIREVERWLHETPTLTLADHTGLEKIQFPPAERLAEAQCAAIANAL